MKRTLQPLLAAMLFVVSGCSVACVSPGVAEEDHDEDGVKDEHDNCPHTRNPTQADFDRDSWGDLCDECPADPLRVRSDPEDGVECAQLVEEVPTPEDAGVVMIDAGASDAGQPDASLPEVLVVTITLNPTTPPARLVEQGEEAIMLVVNASNPSTHAANIFGFTVSGEGVWSPFDVSMISVRGHFSQNGVLSDQFTPLYFQSSPITVPAGSTATFEVSITLAQDAYVGDVIRLKIAPESFIVRSAENGQRFTVQTYGELISNSIGVAEGIVEINPCENVNAGMIIKGSLPALYYVGSNGKRYAFPNELTFMSWFGSPCDGTMPDIAVQNHCASICEVSDTEIATIAIGGNVTIRPGFAMVKIQSEAKVYAVDNVKTLHWVTSEALAVELYGNEWNRRLVDIPDVFFIDYNIGENFTLGASSFFNPETKYRDAKLECELGIPGPECPDILGYLYLTLDNEEGTGITVVKGGTLQNLGHFVVQANVEDANVFSAKVRVCAKNGLIQNTADCDNTDPALLAHVTNVMLVENGVQIAPAQNITTTAGGTFSFNLNVTAGTFRDIYVQAVVEPAFTASNIAVTLQITNAVGTTWNDQLAPTGETLSASKPVIDGGTLTLTSLGNDGVFNVRKLVHADEVDITFLRHQLREISGVEDVVVTKLYYGVKNAVGTFASYKLFSEQTGLQMGNTVSASVVAGTAGEVRFNALNWTIPSGGIGIPLVKGTVVSPGSITTEDNNVDLVPTFIEYHGVTSGRTTRVSGGWLTGMQQPGNPNFQVNDGIQFEAGDKVQIIWDSPDLTCKQAWQELIDTPHCIASVNGNSIQLYSSGCSGSLFALPAEYDCSEGHIRITSFPIVSENHIVHEVEPTIIGLNVGEGDQVVENRMGTFVIRDDGARSLGVHVLRLEVSGAFDDANGYGPRDFKLDRADPVTGARISYTLVGGNVLGNPRLVTPTGARCAIVPGDIIPTNCVLPSGSVIEFDLDEGLVFEEIGGNSTKGYVVVADTTNIKNNGVSGSTATSQVRMLGRKADPVAQATDGLVWSYTHTSNGQSSGVLTESDSYIISGRSNLYQ